MECTAGYLIFAKKSKYTVQMDKIRNRRWGTHVEDLRTELISEGFDWKGINNGFGNRDCSLQTGFAGVHSITNVPAEEDFMNSALLAKVHRTARPGITAAIFPCNRAT